MNPAAKSPNNKYPLVWVEWYDANTRDAWEDVEDAIKRKITPCGTSAQLLKMDDKQLTLVSTDVLDEEDGQVCQLFMIPVCSITNFVILRNGKK